MANRTRFAGYYNAVNYNYGGAGADAPGPLQVLTGTSVIGAGTVTLNFGQVALSDGSNVGVLNINAPITVGAETVTPTAVSNPTPGVYGSATVTATFALVHGSQESVSSATVGLQEAINAASAAGGGIVVVDAAWFALGGTAAILAAATLPSGGNVVIQNNATPSGAGATGQRAGSVTLVSAPATPAAATVASLVGVTGTWTAVTTYVKFVYVTATGGLSAASSEYSFTATVSLAIGGPGPAASAGAVGYLVFIGTSSGVNYQVVVSATSGTPVQCGPISAFKIGTSFTSTTITTIAAPLPPLSSSAFGGTAALPGGSALAVFPPFAAIATVTAGTAQEAARIDFPTGFLNYIGRTVRVKLWAVFTPGSGATLIPSFNLYSLYTSTAITPWTITTAATSGTTQSDLTIELTLMTTAVGATGTLEAHGVMLYAGVTGSAPAYLAAGDAITAASSAIDLTKQDTLTFRMNSGVANLTAVQVRTLTVEVLA